METINISTLKGKASETLRNVRNGETYIVLDRDIPVAEIIPYQKDNKLSIKISQSKLKIPHVSFSINKDPLEFLLEERNKK